MKRPATDMPETPDARGSAPAAPALPSARPRGRATRPIYWSVRRELWENRSIYVAPVAVAGLILFGFLISLIRLPAKMRAALALDPLARHQSILQPYEFAALAIMATTFLVAVLYCLDALHGERRDRSILFWKSLPVSDRTTVLAKAAVAMVVIPLLTFVITVGTQAVMLLLGSLALAGSGMSVSMLWTEVPLFRMSLELLRESHGPRMHGPGTPIQLDARGLEARAIPGVLRFTELRARVGGISQKMLTKSLRQLDRDGLVTRKVHAVVPPRVDYRLTPLGRELGEAVCGIWSWVEAIVEEVQVARRAYDRRGSEGLEEYAERESPSPRGKVGRLRRARRRRHSPQGEGRW